MGYILKRSLLLACATLFITVNSAQALSVGTAEGYGYASHQEGIWQRLGEVNGVNDGVTWSVGGSTFGTDTDLIIGQDVTFRFSFWQGNNGIHTYDQLLAVFDLDQDKVWGEYDSSGTWLYNSDETLIYEKIDTLTPRDQTPTDLSDSRYLTYFSTFTISDSIAAGSSTWLRARVHCNHVEYPDITPYGYINQGEVEDYKLTFVAAPVPEPATMLLFGTGLVGLVGFRLRRKKI